MRQRIRRVAPAGIVSLVVGLAFLLPAGGVMAISTVGYGYGQFAKIGGGLIGGPDAPMGPAPGEDIFIRGNDNAVWKNHYDGATASGFTQLFGLTNGDPGASSSASGTDVFISGQDSQLWQNHWNGTSWGGWRPLGGILSAGPGADVRATTVPAIDVFVRGQDSALWYNTSADAGATWAGFGFLGGGLRDHPGPVSWASDRIDVFIRGLDDQLWHKYWTLAGGWSGWEPLGGILKGGPEAASCAPGHLDIVVLGQGNGYYTMSWSPSTGWTGFSALPGSWTGSPTVVCRPGGGGILDIYGRGMDGALWTMTAPAH
jgi:hypothetical protein